MIVLYMTFDIFDLKHRLIPINIFTSISNKTFYCIVQISIREIRSINSHRAKAQRHRDLHNFINLSKLILLSVSELI